MEKLMATSFVDPIDDAYICAICFNVVRLPLDLECAHLCCAECLQTWSRTRQCCPTCQTPFDLKSCPTNKFVQRTIWRKTVRCPNAGCTQTMVLGEQEKNVEMHRRECNFEERKCDCGERVQRYLWEEHMTQHCTWRQVECEWCKDLFKFIDLRRHQDNELKCASSIICPNSCDQGGEDSTKPRTKRRKGGRRLLLRDLAPHLEVCPLQATTCHLCLQLVPRRELTAHMAENMGPHVEALAMQMKQMRESTRKTEESLQLALVELKKIRAEHNEFLWVLQDLSKNKLFRMDCYSPVYSLSNNGYHFRLRLVATDGYLGLSLWLCDGPHDEALSWPFPYPFTLMILQRAPPHSQARVPSPGAHHHQQHHHQLLQQQQQQQQLHQQDVFQEGLGGLGPGLPRPHSHSSPSSPCQSPPHSTGLPLCPSANFSPTSSPSSASPGISAASAAFFASSLGGTGMAMQTVLSSAGSAGANVGFGSGAVGGTSHGNSPLGSASAASPVGSPGAVSNAGVPPVALVLSHRSASITMEDLVNPKYSRCFGRHPCSGCGHPKLLAIESTEREGFLLNGALHVKVIFQR